LASLFRSCLPIFRKRGLAIGKTLLNTGSDLLGDLQNDMSLRSSFQTRKNDTFEKLRNNVITGEGYKSQRKRKRSQSRSGSGRKHITKKRKTKKSKKNSSSEEKKKKQNVLKN
jgi:hypothetical protein